MIALIKRQMEALGIVLGVVLPILVRTGRRPVIFAKYSGIGDIICTFPAALELKKRHPGATFIYNCHAEYACLPRLGGVTETVTTSQNIGLVGYWYRFLLGGYYLFASDDDDPTSTPKEVYIKDFGRVFGLSLSDEHPPLKSERATVERMKSLLKKKGVNGPMAVIHTGPSWPVREWPRESWAGLAEDLARDGSAQVVQIGTSNHLVMGEGDKAPIPGTVSLMNELTLEESVALISLAQLFVGIDSGLLHIAVSTGVPAMGLWGATSPQFRFSERNRRFFVVSRVECQGCHHRSPRLHWVTGCPYDIKCMKTIAVDEVARASRAGLGAS